MGILGTKSQNRVNWDFLTKFSTTPASLCFTDSLSHTTYVETNKCFNLVSMFQELGCHADCRINTQITTKHFSR